MSKKYRRKRRRKKLRK